jgi:hypothetical protein
MRTMSYKLFDLVLVRHWRLVRHKWVLLAISSLVRHWRLSRTECAALLPVDVAAIATS